MKVKYKGVIFAIYSILYFIFPMKQSDWFYFLIDKNYAGILFLIINLILLIPLILLFVLKVRETILNYKTTKECFKKAGIFTAITFVTLLIIQFILVDLIIGPSLGTGVLMFWFIMGFLIFNSMFYATVFAYKVVMKR